jgi:hypothetical protein
MRCLLLQLRATFCNPRCLQGAGRQVQADGVVPFAVHCALAAAARLPDAGPLAADLASTTLAAAASLGLDHEQACPSAHAFERS